MVQVSCQHCGAPLAIPEPYLNRQVRCPTCVQDFGANAPSPSSAIITGNGEVLTPEIAARLNKIATLQEQIQDCQAHADEYPCYQCNKWVKPFFDYQKVSKGGVAVTNEIGVTLFRENSKLEEFVRCRECGKALGQSGAASIPALKDSLWTLQSQLGDLRVKEKRRLELQQMAKTDPLGAFVMRLAGYWPAVLVAALIAVVTVLVIHSLNEDAKAEAVRVRQAEVELAKQPLSTGQTVYFLHQRSVPRGSGSVIIEPGSAMEVVSQVNADTFRLRRKDFEFEAKREDLSPRSTRP